MNLKNNLVEKIILPFSDLILGRSISKALRFLNSSQWWSLKQLEEYQNMRLRMIIQHSYENTHYYNELFKKNKLKPEDIQTKEDLIKLPILTKKEIKQNFPQKIVDTNLKKKTFYKAVSSGSTGEPLQYYLSKHAYSMNIASHLRGWQWMGYKIGDNFMKISQNLRDTKEKKIQDVISGNNYALLQQLDDKHMLEVISLMQKTKPDFIRAYPDPLYYLSKLCIEKKIKIRPKAITCTGNILYKEARDLIEQAFQAKVFDAYSVECSPVYFECETHSCYHSAMEYAISEFADITEIKKGVFQGKHIITNLWNTAMPFIRYDTQDILEWTNIDCTCGRKLKCVNRILGRNSDILITPKGKKLIVHNFTGYFEYLSSVQQFQIIQDRMDHIIIKLVVTKEYNTDIERKIFNYFNDYIADNVKIEIKVVTQIKTLPSGKRKFLIRSDKIPY